MAITYQYNLNLYNTEAEAQAAVVSMKSRLDNNPTDWCAVKEIQDNGDGTWTVYPTLLTDSEINNLDTSKTYTMYSPYTGENYMPLTASEASIKVNELRTIYTSLHRLHEIVKIDDAVELQDDIFVPVNDNEIITPNEDMTGYL